MIWLWHPESPGMRVAVPNFWWNRRRKFATLGQTIRYSRAVLAKGAYDA